jgi:hypothetical protein
MRTTRHVLYCRDTNCIGSAGVIVEWIEDTYNEAGEWSRDTCRCGNELQAEMAAMYGDVLLSIWERQED